MLVMSTQGRQPRDVVLYLFTGSADDDIFNFKWLEILYFVCVTGRDAEDVDEDYDISLKVMLDSNLFTTAFGFFNEKFV